MDKVTSSSNKEWIIKSSNQNRLHIFLFDYHFDCFMAKAAYFFFLSAEHNFLFKKNDTVKNIDKISVHLNKKQKQNKLRLKYLNHTDRLMDKITDFYLQAIKNK